jgi:hypothetical protein
MASTRYGDFPKASDIEVGTRFVDVRAARWSDSQHSERLVEVVRKTSTRLIVALVDREGNVDADRMFRIIVRNGDVTGKVEGAERFPMDLYTTDDERLEIMRASSRKATYRWEARQAAQDAFHDMTQANARKAVEALQAYLDAYPEAE